MFKEGKGGGRGQREIGETAKGREGKGEGEKNGGREGKGRNKGEGEGKRRLGRVRGEERRECGWKRVEGAREDRKEDDRKERKRDKDDRKDR